MKIMPVFGTRPEAIKMAPIISQLAQRSICHKIDQVVCVTAQHRDMLDQVMGLFGLEADYDLDLMAPNQTPPQVAAAVLTKLDAILRAERPDWILVQGDTTTAAFAALAGYFAGVKVGHVEAGLRTFDKWHPFPEEINRRIAATVADLHFAPTSVSKANLLAEGVDPRSVFVTGNSVIDALHWVRHKLETKPAMVRAQSEDAADILEMLGDRRLVLVTVHRRENFGAPLIAICSALKELAQEFNDDILVALPVHPNPNVRGPVYESLGGMSNVRLLAPLDYLPLVALMKRAHLVVTDSGGIQEEAPAFGKPVLVLRTTTERPEAVDAGTVALVGTDKETILARARLLLTDPLEYDAMAKAVNPYGDGRASERIADALLGEAVSEFTPDANA